MTRASPYYFAPLLAMLAGCSGESSKVRAPVHAAQQWCVAAGGVVDSAFAVEQARNAVIGSTFSSSSMSLKPYAIQPVEQGILVSLVSAGPGVSLGGGGLVWIDGETGCPILLKRYE
jgi:phage-related tail fiber protein